MENPAESGSVASRPRRLTLGQILALVAVGPAVVVIVSVLLGILAIAHQNAVRSTLLTRVEPANAAALELEIAMLNQETGIRGYALTGEPGFLAPYHVGVRRARASERQLGRDAVGGTGADLRRALVSIHLWESQTATPALARPAGSVADTPARRDTSLRGKAEFDAIRVALDALQAKLLARVRSTKAQLVSSAHTTEIAFAVIGGALIISLLLAGGLLRRFVTRPIDLLTAAARRVAGGELDHQLALSGPRDLERLAGDLDAMRLALLGELAASRAMGEQLTLTATELTRSNTELEQFAYVASHDLQEPLRKVTSFVQLLSDRYAGQLDDRADQYIGFAVDGAKRMQQLINDLLAFSRVGRGDPKLSPTPLKDVLETALADLAVAIADSGAEVEVAALPIVAVEPTLIRTVLVNLIGNALKFRSDATPRVRVEAQRDGDFWRLTCSDNGIGIDAQYADRIFIIFQRLHTREIYPGTGIGLAMCRKIVESHGGRMWLDTAYTGGTRMCFTLPAWPTRAPGDSTE